MAEFYPASGYPASKAELAKFRGMGGPLNRFLQTFAYKDRVFFFDDFLGDTINLDNYALANSGGAGAANFAIQVLRSGVIRSATGTTDDGSLSLIGPAIWYGDANCGMEIRFKYDVVTGYNTEVGFAAAVPGSNASAVTDIDTPTVLDETAVLQIDTDQTLTTLAFATGGTSFTDTATTVTGTTVLTAATYAIVRIQLIGNMAACWINGYREAVHSGDKVEGGNPLALWVYSRTRNTTTKLLDIDYVAMWQDR